VYRSSDIPTAETPRQKKQASKPASPRGAREIRDVGQDEISQLLVALASRATAHGEDPVHAGIQEALAQDSLPDHSGRAEEQDVHADTLRDTSFQKRFSSISVIRCPFSRSRLISMSFHRYETVGGPRRVPTRATNE